MNNTLNIGRISDGFVLDTSRPEKVWTFTNTYVWTSWTAV